VLSCAYTCLLFLPYKSHVCIVVHLTLPYLLSTHCTQDSKCWPLGPTFHLEQYYQPFLVLYTLEFSLYHKLYASVHVCIYIYIHNTHQDDRSCLCVASEKGYVQVVNYLCRRGGKKLTLMTDSVSMCCACSECEWVYCTQCSRIIL
jgi:hypothetical protein